MNLRSWIKKTQAGRIVWRVIIGVIGGGITVAGSVALIGPGPGILIVLAGLGILATEFAWAGRVMMRTKEIAARTCLLYTSPSPRDRQKSRMPSSA